MILCTVMIAAICVPSIPINCPKFTLVQLQNEMDRSYTDITSVKYICINSCIIAGVAIMSLPDLKKKEKVLQKHVSSLMKAKPASSVTPLCLLPAVSGLPAVISGEGTSCFLRLIRVHRYGGGGGGPTAALHPDTAANVCLAKSVIISTTANRRDNCTLCTEALPPFL